uniref:Akirin n=1 Tax=Cacopsylla melanoneura TaxID=428564 RepID=A0A8D8WH95_9HEMI
MACATLKRPLEFDPLHSPAPTKRPRCMPMCISPSNSPPRNLSSPPRPSTSSGTMTNPNTPFVSCVAKLTPDVIANGIFEEMKRLHRRKELHLPTASTSCASDDHNPLSSALSSSSSSADQSTSTDDRDKPIFTFRQVEYICSKMLSEQEGRLRVEYDAILNDKLKEQFDIFNRFSVDQIDRLAKHNNSQALSYLS